MYYHQQVQCYFSEKIPAKETNFIGVPINNNYVKSNNVGTNYRDSFDLKKVKKEVTRNAFEYQHVKVKEEKHDEEYERAYRLPFDNVSKQAESDTVASSVDGRRALNSNAHNSASNMDTTDHIPIKQAEICSNDKEVMPSESKQDSVNNNNQHCVGSSISHKNDTSGSGKPCQRKRPHPNDVDVASILPGSKRRKITNENMNCGEKNNKNIANSKCVGKTTNRNKRLTILKQKKVAKKSRDETLKRSMTKKPSNTFRSHNLPEPSIFFNPNFTKIELKQCEFCKRAWFNYQEFLIAHIEKCSKSQTIAAKDTNTNGEPFTDIQATNNKNLEKTIIGAETIVNTVKPTQRDMSVGSSTETKDKENNHLRYFEIMQSGKRDGANNIKAGTEGNDSKLNDDSNGFNLKHVKRENYKAVKGFNTCGDKPVNIKKEKYDEEYDGARHKTKLAQLGTLASVAGVEKSINEKECSDESNMVTKTVSVVKYCMMEKDLNNNENLNTNIHSFRLDQMSEREASKKKSSDDVSQKSDKERNLQNKNRVLKRMKKCRICLRAYFSCIDAWQEHERMCKAKCKEDNAKAKHVNVETKLSDKGDKLNIPNYVDTTKPELPKKSTSSVRSNNENNKQRGSTLTDVNPIDGKETSKSKEPGLKVQSNESFGKSRLKMCAICRRAWFNSDSNLLLHAKKCFPRRDIQMYYALKGI
ncbi:hypothetical protein ACF0H5_003082 [Mactra antiquata]